MSTFLLNNGAVISIIALIAMLSNHLLISFIIKRKPQKFKGLQVLYNKFLNPDTSKIKKPIFISYFIIASLIYITYLGLLLPLNQSNYQFISSIYLTSVSVILTFFIGNLIASLLSLYLFKATNAIEFQKIVSITNFVLGIILLSLYFLSTDYFFLIGQVLTIIGLFNYLQIKKYSTRD